MLEKRQTVPSTDLSPKVREIKTQDRLRFWQIQEFFKCPVVGMCLTPAEQQQLLKKTNVSLKKTSPFERHEALVASSESENSLSRRIDKLLQRKLGKEAGGLLGLDHEGFRAHFKTAVAGGDLAAALWATAIHPQMSFALKREIFGEIHMIMHWSGEQRMHLRRKLTRQQAALEDARRRIKTVAQQKRALQKENDSLRRGQDGLKTALAAAEKEKNTWAQNPAGLAAHPQMAGLERQNRILQEELDTVHWRLRRQQQQSAALKTKNRQLTSQLACQAGLNNRFRQETRTIMAQMVAENRCHASCPSFDLCQKRILIVGGMSRMESLYRELIEGRGGIFEYHDGYMQKGTRRLEYRLKRADVVLCPVSCNSHTACAAVKRLAKKHNKTVHMLSNFSLKAVSQAIWGTAADRMVN